MEDLEKAALYEQPPLHILSKHVFTCQTCQNLSRYVKILNFLSSVHAKDLPTVQLLESILSEVNRVPVPPHVYMPQLNLQMVCADYQ